MPHCLFVYGSLAPGRANAHILEPLQGNWQPASVRGHLRQAGWGASLGFPGLIPDPAGEPVAGQLFVSDNLDAFWPELDVLEGTDYTRVLVDATLADGSSVPAYVYRLNA
jgi:gamma-glutamylcyclotransferase (GGCT)/AIG2-like uncharacterized protein YtfP